MESGEARQEGEPAVAVGSEGASALRHRAAWVCAGLAGLIALPVVAGAVSGPYELSFGGLRATVGSLRMLRWTVVLSLAAAWLDPSLARAAVGWFERRRRVVLLTALGAAIAWLVAYKVYQHLALRTGAYDLSMFHHAVHNTLRGKFLHAFGIDRNFFSEHFSPALLWTVPVYAVAQSATTLLVIEGAVVGLALWPLYRLSLHVGLVPHHAALVSAGFFANALLWRAFEFDFHIELFEPVLFFAAAAALYARRFGLFHLALLGLLMVKEDAFLLALPLSALVVWRRREDWPHAVASAVLALVWAVVAFKVAIPLSYPAEATQSHFVGRYGHLGQSYGEIVGALVTQPGYVLGRIFSVPVLQVVQSVGFLPLLDPVVLVLGLPALGIHLISGYDYQASLGVYYGLGGLLVFFLSVPRVVRFLQVRGWEKAALMALVLPLVVMPEGRFHPKSSEADAAGRAVVRAIPVAASISAQTSLLPHLSPDGPRLLFPEVAGADYVALDLERSPWPSEQTEYLANVRTLLDGEDYGVEAFDGRFLVLRKGANPARNAEVRAAVR